MEPFVDYYELLHVQPTAPAAVIKASYRTMLQKLNHHPDRGGDVAFAQLLNKAAETLCKPDTRAQYDSLRRQYIIKPQQPEDRGEPDDKAAGFSWGEPGGSPGTSSQDKQPSETRPDRKQETRPAAQISLPVKDRCLFCLTPEPETSQTSVSGYTLALRCRGCNGARTPIEQIPQINNEELRRMHRQHHASAAKMWTEWPKIEPEQSLLADFSPVGCALTNSRPLTKGQVVMIETPLFNAICKVTRSQRAKQGTYTIGLAFVTLDMQAAPGSLLDATA